MRSKKFSRQHDIRFDANFGDGGGPARRKVRRRVRRTALHVKGFVRFTVLVTGLIGAWIAVASALGRDDGQAMRLAPPLQLVEAAIEASRGGVYDADVSRKVVLETRKQRDTWTLRGVALVRSAAGEVTRKPYSAVMRSLCDAYAQRRCWALQKLNLGASAMRAPVPAPAPSKTLHGAGRMLAIQRRLKAVGFAPGPLDGQMGPRTRTAIRAYQRAYGWTADGRPDGDLLDRLEVDVLFLRGLRYFNDGDYRRAMGQYARIIELRPDSSDAYFNHGLIYRKMGLPDLAIGDYDAALRLRPGHTRALRDRGNAYYQKGLYAAATWDYADSLTSWLFGGMTLDRIDQELAIMAYSLKQIIKG